MPPDGEVPFPADPELTYEPPSVDGGIGWVHFIDPKHGYRTGFPVTLGASHEREQLGPVWHIEFPEPGIAVTSPSVHFVGSWHSPNPTRWRVVEQLADGRNADAS